MSAAYLSLVTDLERAEMLAQSGDARRVLRDERCAVMAAADRLSDREPSGFGSEEAHARWAGRHDHYAKVCAEARRVLAMWAPQATS